MTEKTTERTTEEILSGGASLPPVDPQDEFAVQIADQVESFLIALKAVAAEGNPGTGISLLLLEISQLLLAGARLGAQVDFTPTSDYQPDVGPDQLHITELLKRLADGAITEVILATDPNLEGEATATYLTRMLKPLELRITRLASGLPVGGDLEYADEVTLGRAFAGRRSAE